MHTRLLSKSLLHALALVAGLVAGCVFTTGDGDDGDCPGSNIHESFGECFCDAGYEWEDPNDSNNLTCVPEMAKDGACEEANNVVIDGTCYCDDGYSWCSSDPNDFSCCEDPGHSDAGTGGSADDVADTNDSGDTGADTGTDTGADTGADTGIDDTGPDSGVEPDPADCTEDGLNFCSNTEEMGPEGSRVWVCMGGEWVENSTIGDESCMFDGFDFAYGCTSSGDAVQFVCGDGPGTACDGAEASCVDADVINYCLYGKLSEDSCLRICTEEGDDMGVTYEHGQCDSETNECFCCDSGDEGCAI